MDRRLLEVMRTRGHTPALERAAGGLSKLGEHGTLWIAIGAAGVALDSQHRAHWRRATRAVALSYVLNTSVKLLVRRRRPTLEGLPPLASAPTQLSFPSAHSATAFAGAVGYSRLGVPAVPLYGLAAVTALSRVYLGLHYPSDIVAGATLGSVVAALSGRRQGALRFVNGPSRSAGRPPRARRERALSAAP